jgi:prolycopene isomerase
MVQPFVKDPAAQSVLSTLWPYMGLPPSKCSAIQFAEMMMSFVNQHAHYVEGSFQKLADAFVFALEKAGSELVIPRTVEKILLDDKGRACGVKLDKAGEEIRARYVISNVDAYQTFLGMIGEERLDAGFVSTLKERPISLSAFEVFLGVTTDLKGMGINHEIFFGPSSDTEEAFSSQARGEVHGCGLSIPSIDDHTLAPPGHHTVCVKMFAPWDRRWVEDKPALTERLIDEAEKVIPGLRKGIVYQEAGTPFTMSRYTGNTAGAMYGWDAAPKSITQRLNMETPVPGLFLSGHWTRPGGGVLAVIISGQMAAKRVFQELRNQS